MPLETQWQVIQRRIPLILTFRWRKGSFSRHVRFVILRRSSNAKLLQSKMTGVNGDWFIFILSVSRTLQSSSASVIGTVVGGLTGWCEKHNAPAGKDWVFIMLRWFLIIRSALSCESKGVGVGMTFITISQRSLSISSLVSLPWSAGRERLWWVSVGPVREGRWWGEPNTSRLMSFAETKMVVTEWDGKRAVIWFVSFCHA